VRLLIVCAVLVQGFVSKIMAKFAGIAKAQAYSQLSAKHAQVKE
jgi:hypothetical protein